MENLKPVLPEIVQLTTKLQTEYPELYQFLDENPITLPAGFGNFSGLFVEFERTVEDLFKNP